MTDSDLTRRRFVAAIGALSTGASAGCVAVEPPSGSSGSTDGVATSELGDERFADLYEAVAPSVVEIRLPGGLGPGRSGSGFMIGDDQIVTNDHVVRETDAVEIRYRDQEWGDATVLQSDIHSDLAVIDASPPPAYVESLSIDAEFPRIGSEVMAIGSPFGFGGSATVGIVSGVNRSLPSPTGFSIPAAIQTDAAVNPGNSGGPLVGLSGGVLGVIFAGAGDNIGFAISGPLVNEVLPVLRQGDAYEHSFMGVQLLDITPSIAAANEVPEVAGVYVEGVIDGSPADGVLIGTDGQGTVNGVSVPTGGDVIVSIDGVEIGELDGLSAHLAIETRAGDTIDIEIIRDGSAETVELTLGSRPTTVGGMP